MYYSMDKLQIKSSNDSLQPCSVSDLNPLSKKKMLSIWLQINYLGCHLRMLPDSPPDITQIT